MHIGTIKDLKAAVRGGDYSSIGGYTVIIVLADGSVCKPSAVRENFREYAGAIRDHAWNRPALATTYDEGEPVECAISGEMIKSSYGSPEGFQHA